MTLDEAGRRKEAWKAKFGAKTCKHERMVDYLVSRTGKKTGYLACMECGEHISESLTSLHAKKIS